MEFDQILFKKVIGFFDKWKSKNSKEEISRTIELSDISGRLTLIARALTGKNIDILPAENEGGWKNNSFYLPTSFSLLPRIEDNLNYYIFRTVYLSIQSEENLNWEETNTIQNIDDSRNKALDVGVHVLNIMEADYPSVSRFFLSIKQYFGEEENPDFWLYGKYMSSGDVLENEQGQTLDKDSYKKNTVNPSTEIKSKPVEEAEVISVNKKAQDDYVMTHNFEKVETAEEFSGVWRGFDGDDTLEEDSDALDELNLTHLVRTDEVANSIYQADFRDLANVSSSGDIQDDNFFLTYKEWNFSKKRYLPDYCKVFLKKMKGGDLNYAKRCLSENKKSLDALRRKFAQIHQQRNTVKKLPDGESIDIDSLVDWFADLKSGRTPSDNIYQSKRKKEPDLAVLFLLDLSLSTDGYANGNRVLDVEKQAVILFGEVLSEYNVDFAVTGFYSKTRNNCVYHTLKDFNDTWTKGKQRIGAVEPEGYTRIGPALRHSQSLIESQDAKQKWVILLSDGKPNDYDKYEGKYGVADVKQALREMHERRINTYAIAIESIARYYLPQMFGQNHYNILTHPEMLISSLTILYRRINNC
jgi:nitric oxide reductase NorD protein